MIMKFGSVALLLILATLTSSALMAIPNSLDCWAVDTGMCNTPTGDCEYKSYGQTCYSCDAAAPLSAVCVWRPNYVCLRTAVPIDCGNRWEGVCGTFGCPQYLPVGSCIVYDCVSGGGGET